MTHIVRNAAISRSGLTSSDSYNHITNADDTNDDDTAALVYTERLAGDASTDDAAGGHGGSGWFASSMIIINAALGAGILNLPAAFDKAGGILPATIVHVLLLISAVGSILVLAWCSDLGKSASYQDTVALLCGVWGRRICSLIIAVYMYGACITFLIIAGDQSDRLLLDKVGADFCSRWYLRRGAVVSAAATLVVLPLCYSRTIDFLKYISIAATAAVFYLVAVAVYVFCRTDTSHVVVRTEPAMWTDVLTVIPAICFGYQCHVSVIPVYACLRPHSLGMFVRAVSLALTVCFVSYSTVGVVGMLTYGTNIQSDILSLYDTNDKFVFVGFLIFGLKTLLTYPILLFCGRLAVDSLWTDFFPSTGAKINVFDAAAGANIIAESDISLETNAWWSSEGFRRVVVTTPWFATTLLVSVIVPDMAAVLNVLGSFATLFIYVFPGVCLLRATTVFKARVPRTRVRLTMRALGVAYVIFGVFLFGLTLAQSLEYDLFGLPASPAHSKHGRVLCRP